MPIEKMKTEADMCKAFIDVCVTDKWIAYPETAGFDILLAHKEYGTQIGIEAKQTLNPKVLDQALEGVEHYHRWGGPDFRAILVPKGGTRGLENIAKKMGVTIIRYKGKPIDGKNRCKQGEYGYTNAFYPELPNIDKPFPSFDDGRVWYDWCPDKRCALPDYIPDVRAGVESPKKLTQWKVKAIKISILLEKQGYITSSDFSEIDISMHRWIQSKWIVKDKKHKGLWRKTQYMPNFEKQHPVNYKQIRLDLSWQKTIQTQLF